MVDWPTDADIDGPRRLKPQRIGPIDTAINADHSSLAKARLEILRLGEMDGTQSGAQHGTASPPFWSPRRAVRARLSASI
ncbi:MAG: hypothetical protein ACT6VE_28060 [Shinella sp.]